MPAAEARRAALRAFGRVEPMKDAWRDQGGLPWVDAVRHDVRFAVRLLAKRPGFTALAIGALALGIGVNSAFFTIVNAHCLRGLPIEHPERVLAVGSRDAERRDGAMSYLDFRDVRAALTTVEDLSAYTSGPVTIGDEGRAPDRVRAAYVSAGAFRVLRTSPAIGRDFQPADDRYGAPLVCLLGDALWRSRYGGDRGVIGRTVQVDGEPATVIGVMLGGFAFPSTAELWLPIESKPGLTAAKRDARALSVFGRLGDGMTREHAGAELTAAAVRLAKALPETNRGVDFVAVPINDVVNGKITDTVWKAFITVGVIVLLVACANVANLLLMGSVARSREIAVRASMGASRARIVRQLLIESAVLAALGGACGIGLSVVATRALANSVPAAGPLPYWITYVIDARVLAMLVAACAFTVLVSGLAPALHASRARLTDVLGGGSQPGAAAFRMRAWTAGFLALEFGLSFVLLANIALVVRNDLAPKRGVAEVRPEELLIGSLSLPARAFGTVEQREGAYADLDDRLSAIAGVAAASVMSHAPSEGAFARQLDLEQHPLAAGETRPIVQSVVIGPGYFSTLRLPIARGRAFTDRDGSPGAERAIVNERFATTYFPRGDAVGRRIRLTAPEQSASPGPWLTIVGVSPTMQQRSAGAEPIVYVPYRGSAPASVTLLVRAAGVSPAAIAPAVREAMRQVAPDVPLSRLMPLEQALHDRSWNGRVSATILYTVSAIAFLLALVGLYAVTAHTVLQRTQEIGLRMALGAAPRQISWLVMRRALVQLAGGLVLGVLLTVWWGRRFTSPTDPISLTDPSTLVPLMGVIAAVAALACLVPTRRAAHLDPLTALRHE
jgi:putative ABC transport system permease protein